LLQANPHLKIVCTGTPFTEDELALFSALDIERQMLQMFVSSSELYNLYHHARAFVFPSAYEGFGIPILEAFACHCPVLLNRASCFPEIAGDAASYFDIRSEKGDYCLAKALQGILYDDGERDKKILQGAKRLQDFSWEKSAMQLARIYRSLL
jgi:glycosyltransferase involved in cell wall biosynthesis